MSFSPEFEYDIVNFAVTIVEVSTSSLSRPNSFTIPAITTMFISATAIKI